MLPGRWRDRWIARRNALLSDPRFQRWAADFPLTRRIAARRASGLFDLVAGFVYSQTLGACVRLGVLDVLAEGPASAEVIATGVSLPVDAAEHLLRAAAALGLAERAGVNRYALGSQGAALLGNAGLKEMIIHHAHLYADLADPTGLLRRESGRRNLAAYWPYATSDAPQQADPNAVAAYSALMAATQPAVAADILHAYPFRRHRRLLDVGGGEGAFLVAAAAAAPQIRLTLFDLPAVTLRAQQRLSRAGLLDRTDIFSGDFLSDPIPQGADLITLVRILHDHDDGGVVRILTSARAALPPGGALLIAEPMSGAPARDRVADVYFAFYLLAMGRGRARTPDEIVGFLREAGFREVRVLKTRTPFLLRAILARP